MGRRPLVRIAGLVTAFAALAALAVAPAADAVILTDGFVIQGKVLKEGTTGNNYGFDVVDDGPKVIVFSAHTQKGGKVEKDVLRPDWTAYRKPYPGTRGFKMPAFGEMKPTEFDEKWRRSINIRQPDGNFTKIEQMVTYLDPNSMFVASTTHGWRLAYHTEELDPKVVRFLLTNHPDLKDKDPKAPDPMKRLAIASFLKDAGWLDKAKDELETARREIPGEWPKEVVEREDKLKAEIEAAENRLVVDTIEAAVNAGRYEYARGILASFNPKTTDAKDTTRLTVAKAQVDTRQPKFESARSLLRSVLDRAVQGDGTVASPGSLAGVVIGGTAVATGPKPKLAEPLATLVDAGEVILAELHPDTALRVELFATLAQQAETKRAAGKPPGNTPEQLLALAVTGWLKGKNGADPNPAAAVKCWATREMATAYLRAETGVTRAALLEKYLKSGNALSADELAQLISLLPPVDPADLTKPLGTPVTKADAGIDGIWKCVTVPDQDGPVEYLLRLPPEYHHGRSYPVVLGLNDPRVPIEKMTGGLAPACDKFGYILACPKWTGTFDDAYDFSGKHHRLVNATLRDLTRRFQVDPDRVFLFGFGEGANFAFDMGIAHPDLFAGVCTFGGSPKPDLFMHTWRNAQKLPFYVVTGEMGAGSAQAMRKVFERWMPRGYPALLTMYKGRGVEWFNVEIPKMFDWMNRKSRVRGTASLRLNSTSFEPWQIARTTDDRFYWVGTSGVKPQNTMEKTPPGKPIIPATIQADVRPGNLIDLKVFGTTNVVVWLERDMIDWSRPVKVQVNGRVPNGYVAKEMVPDLHVLFEELYRTGDRKMLFLGKMVFDTPNS